MDASELKAFSLNCKVCQGAGAVGLSIVPKDDSLGDSAFLLIHCGACHTLEEHTVEYSGETEDF